MGKFYQSGDYEKSYIMARELLEQGMPVLYERVFDTNTGAVDRWTPYNTNAANAKIKSATPGIFGSCIRFTITKIDENEDRHKLSVWVEGDSGLGIPDMSKVDTFLTFTSNVAKKYKDIQLLSKNCTVVDKSNLLSITIGDTDGDSALEFTPVTGEDACKLTFSSGDVLSDDEFTVKGMYDYLVNTAIDTTTGQQLGFKRLEDKGEYVLKFITSGAYPTYELATPSVISESTIDYSGITPLMMKVAANRGDCVALIDHTPNNKRVVSGEDSLYESVQTYFSDTMESDTFKEDCNTFATMFTPYGVYETFKYDQMLPASFGYLKSFAIQSNQYNGWLATAGVTRGRVVGLKSLCQNITNAVADSCQPRDGIAINPITNVRPYGLTLWGARTLKNNALAGDLTATSFLNIRNITSDVKRQVYVAAKTLTFEQNSDILWIKFKNKVTPLLDTMINSNAISSYSLKRQKTDLKATVKAVVRLYAIEPVEDWDITIELADSSTDVVG